MGGVVLQGLQGVLKGPQALQVSEIARCGRLEVGEDKGFLRGGKLPKGGGKLFGGV
jgi:hypothetical protein